MLLELDHLSKTYASPDGGPSVNVLRDVCLRLDAGEVKAVEVSDADGLVVDGWNKSG